MLIENLEIENAMEIYKSCTKLIPNNCVIVVSFIQYTTNKENLTILSLMKEFYKTRICRYLTSIFYDFADNYSGFLFDEVASTIDFKQEQESKTGEPEIKKSKVQSIVQSETKDIEETLRVVKPTCGNTNYTNALGHPEITLLDFSNKELYKMETDKYLIDKYSYAYLHHLYDTKEF